MHPGQGSDSGYGWAVVRAEATREIRKEAIL